ncbi:complex I NDUFA9 subunit family protein [Novosphingobium sp. ZN18A2]|uniref:complex I NDUFA9 subunit family protein n=1 Tax=Novosphingobium sp. ZN18A2 TaxID=3079861 RepID=UPI0030D626B8
MTAGTGDSMGKTTRDLEGRIVTLIGGSGFFGTHIAQELLSRGARLRICSRHPEKAWRVKPLANLGQVQFGRVDVTKPETVAAAFAGADAAVNLVGAFAGDLDSLQGEGAGRVAAAARDAGVSAYVHVSAIGTDASSAVGYARTKAEGETAVLAAFPKATVLRPSVLFAEDDEFVTMFAGLISTYPVLPVFGPQAKLQPLFVDDAAEAVAQTLADPASHGGKTYELAGPDVLTMLELNRRIAAAQGRKRVFVELPDGVSGLIAALPGTPINRDQWALLQAGNVAGGTLPGLGDLGVKARPLSLFLDRWMTRYRKHGRFGERAAA